MVCFAFARQLYARKKEGGQRSTFFFFLLASLACVFRLRKPSHSFARLTLRFASFCIVLCVATVVIPVQ